MQTKKIRTNFLNYFKNEGHALIPSSPVVPFDDPTLLFTNAGMNQFKDVFLGKSARDYKRAASSQKCVRVGGKHNDLENVGHTSRHLTFFEMVGNFSFGDYFKEEAIRFAWEVATKSFELDPDKIWPTVFREDDEAFEIWRKYVPADRITRFDEKDNFWAMGETGPCGPCSELLYDRGEKFGSAKKPIEDTSGERFLEFWNLVFMQYNRDNGILNPLPKPSIDTGAGLERIVSLKMGVDSLFETDILKSLILKTEEVLKVPYKNDDKAAAFKVIADHLRCLSFAIADGVQPSNVDRGYVLRKVLRRAVRYGRQLGAEKPFLGLIFPELLTQMGDDYPELKKSEKRILEILEGEEEAFLKTLKRGGNLLNQIVETSKSSGIIKGDEAFKLKDTYGLPLEEILLIARDFKLKVDLDRFEKLEEEAKEKSRASRASTKQLAEQNLFENMATTRFLGYQELASPAKVIALLKEGAFEEALQEGDEGTVILDQTPFYAEMGGQVGDKGSLSSDTSSFIVSDTRSPFKGIVAHIGKVNKGSLKVGDELTAQVDHNRREKIASNHTATHLLHWALFKVLGEHIKQAGSVVDSDRLRFDFSHHKPLSPEEIRSIEDLVNEEVRRNRKVKVYELSYDEASKRPDIKQFFGEKYGAKVRVIDIEESKELCGGTHLQELGSIGLFKIVKEGSIAAGVRRIEAVTGAKAIDEVRLTEDALDKVAAKLKTDPAKLEERLDKLLDEQKTLNEIIKKFKKDKLDVLAKELVEKKETVKGASILVAQTKLDSDDLKLLSDQLFSQFDVVALANDAEGRPSILIRVKPNQIVNFDAGKLIKAVAPIIEGSGGGKAESAQAGGKNVAKLGEALEEVKRLIRG
jgi:alanyl-tRNA synthetase